VLQKEDDDWVKKSMKYEAEGPKPRGRQRGPGQRLWKRTVNHVNWKRMMLDWMLWIVVDGGS